MFSRMLQSIGKRHPARTLLLWVRNLNSLGAADPVRPQTRGVYPPSVCVCTMHNQGRHESCFSFIHYSTECVCWPRWSRSPLPGLTKSATGQRALRTHVRATLHPRQAARPLPGPQDKVQAFRTPWAITECPGGTGPAPPVPPGRVAVPHSPTLTPGAEEGADRAEADAGSSAGIASFPSRTHHQGDLEPAFPVEEALQSPGSGSYRTASGHESSENGKAWKFSLLVMLRGF